MGPGALGIVDAVGEAIGQLFLIEVDERGHSCYIRGAVGVATSVYGRTQGSTKDLAHAQVLLFAKGRAARIRPGPDGDDR